MCHTGAVMGWNFNPPPDKIDIALFIFLVLLFLL
jgi:hypothetical protein